MIVLRSAAEIEAIRQAGRIVALTLEKMKMSVKAGTKTKELDEMAREEILKEGGEPAFKDYKGFPGNICTSVNEVVVHGIPSKRQLEDGDIIAI
ncbi:MAG: M24 family metallopeptidase, partial [Candidatus Omnitrophota bacterium]|nr:M24 family metallopeptidase [Candidatus Omnitrophota bacterium]